MRKKIKLSVGPGIEVEEIMLRDGRWVVSARAVGERSCPGCGDVSTSRHDWHRQRLQDLPVQGTPLVLDLRLGRWRCLNERCSRKTFVERLPSVAAPMARRTVRVAEIVRLFGHAAGGLPSERLLARLAMPISDIAILRQLKRHVRERADPAPLRAIAIDDWSWRKGFTYGTIVVDLERRTVADVLETRSAKETADWLARRPEIEIVSRDRCGLETSRRREATREERTIDPVTGWQISPLVAAALCMKPTRLLTHSQAAKVTVSKEASPSFVVMRRLAMRFRGLLRGADPGKLGSWLDDARHSGIHALQQFARTLARDIDAVRNAIAEP